MGIRMHPKLGANPHMMACHACGEAYGVMLLGDNDSIWECGHGTKCVGRPDQREYKCGCAPRNFAKKRRIEEHEKIVNGTCDPCIARFKLQDEWVKEGGIYFKCTDCGCAGAIRANSEIAQDVRLKLKIEAPAPCGIDFDKNTCPQCGPEELRCPGVEVDKDGKVKDSTTGT